MDVKLMIGAAGFAVMGGIMMPVQASAITAELAKTCRELTVKQFPPREPGNPAAGSDKGSGRDQEAYYNKCVANNGKVDNGPGK